MDSNKATQRSLDSFHINLKTHILDSFFPNAQRFHESAKPQEFSLPMPIMKYIWSNPSSPEVYQKLIKTCKFFFIKNPILILNALDNFLGWNYCAGNKCGEYPCKKKHRALDMDKFKDKKIWVSKRFRAISNVSNAKSNLVSQLIPKICRFDVIRLVLNDQLLSYDELKFLTTGAKDNFINSNIVKYTNGEEVPLEEIIKLFSGARYVWMNFSNGSYNAACKSFNEFIDACNTIRKVELHLIPDVFNVKKFYQQLKASKNEFLIAINSTSNQIFLDEVIGEILKTETFEFVPPVITYYGLYDIKLNKMKQIQAQEVAKYR